MKTISVVSTVMLVLVIGFAATVEAQIPKEGSSSMTFVYSATYKALPMGPMGQERLQMTYENMGVIIGDTGNELLHNTSVRCLGALHAVKGETNNSGFCVGTRPDGDQIFWTYQSTGKLGAGSKGTSTIVGGTGKFIGIQGSSEYTDSPLRPAAEGTFQGYSKVKGQYKLP